MRGKSDDIGNVLHATKTIFKVFTGIGRSKNHRQETRGLSYRHFVIGGVLAALILVSTLVALVHFIAASQG